ncbi:glycosyltransferase family 4 protein [Gluconacetobacter tumulisoli]|uniref:Glycosyltransferase family 4 protein n=1 Tax=Gluconacetobacter tumulisoli TaxID=1286189 RepID=A0A7W4PKJ2_9PROT|nr:glycosyltransferase family 1 protein [Gluconacetobacter tumulisoli]MBB2201130.1 glycosyltransferase family 4 protein [Gluconacetobacter tumulisoli]
MAQKRILFDGYNLGLETGTGVATYARNLTYCAHDLGYGVDVLYGTRAAPGKSALLREIAFFDPHVGNPPRWLEWSRWAKQLTTSWMGLKAKAVPMTGAVIPTHFRSRMPYADRFWNIADLWGRADRHEYLFGTPMRTRIPQKPDLMHWTYPIATTMPGVKNIYTLHDLVPLRLPFTTLDNKRRYFNRVRRIVRKADHIVTVSETSRQDIINLLGVPEDRVTNTFQAVDIPAKYANKTEETVSQEVEGTYNLKYKNYMLFFGAIEPKKNIGRMIEAYLSSKIDTPLVIVGKLAWKAEQELRLLNDDTIRYLEHIDNQTFSRHRILRIDYATFPLLVSLIRGARAVLFPSLYEGFGLPVLEAMMLGTPVLTSNSGALAEVAGDAALLCDPYDVRQMADGIRKLDSDAELRSELAQRGLKQAALFSADRYRARMSELYDRVI